MKKVKWRGPPVDIGIGRRQEPDTNALVNNDDGEDNPDDWEDVTLDADDGWDSDNSENGTPDVDDGWGSDNSENDAPGVEEAKSMSNDDSDDSDLFFWEHYGSMDSDPEPQPTFDWEDHFGGRIDSPRTPVPDQQPTLGGNRSTIPGIPDDFELIITPEMIQDSRERRQRRNEDIERTRISREDKNSAGESKNSAGESKNSEENNDVYTRPFKRMRNLRLRF